MSKRMPSPLRRWRLLIGLAAIYVFLLVVNSVTAEYSECITDSWCISSKRDLHVMSALQSLSISLIVLAFLAGLRIVKAMLASKHRHWWLLLFFSVLSVGGACVWLLTSTPAERSATAHIPFIAAFIFLTGVALFFGYRRIGRK